MPCQNNLILYHKMKNCPYWLSINVHSFKELNPSLPCEWSAANPVHEQVFIKITFWIKKNIKIDFKIMKILCTVQEFGTFSFQFPFFFEIFQCTNTANILLCNKMHLKWTHKVFFHIPWQKNLNWFPRRGSVVSLIVKVTEWGTPVLKT